jgi:hypothetical protein
VRSVSPLVALALALAACDRDGPLDTVSDSTLDAAVWRGDGQKISAAMPHAVGAFVPVEGVDAFSTSYSTGPVFGASCTYGDGARQLTVRVESGNIRVHAASLDTRPGVVASDSGFVTRQAVVHGRPAALRWSEKARTGEVTFLVQRRFLVEVRVSPATSADEAVSLASSIDLAPLESLVLDGVTH